MQTAAGDRIAGAGILDLTTSAGRHRAVGEVVAEATAPGVALLTGFETTLGTPPWARTLHRWAVSSSESATATATAPTARSPTPSSAPTCTGPSGPQPRPRRPAAAPRHRPHPLPAAGPPGGRGPAAALAHPASPAPSAGNSPGTTGRGAQPSGVLPAEESRARRPRLARLRVDEAPSRGERRSDRRSGGPGSRQWFRFGAGTTGAEAQRSIPTHVSSHRRSAGAAERLDGDLGENAERH
jgi:hypothetical protein